MTWWTLIDLQYGNIISKIYSRLNPLANYMYIKSFLAEVRKCFLL